MNRKKLFSELQVDLSLMGPTVDDVSLLFVFILATMSMTGAATRRSGLPVGPLRVGLHVVPHGKEGL